MTGTNPVTGMPSYETYTQNRASVHLHGGNIGSLTRRKLRVIAQDRVAADLLDPVSGVKIPLATPVSADAAASAHSRARSVALSKWKAEDSFLPPPFCSVTGRTYSILLPNTAFRHGGRGASVVVGSFQTEDFLVP